MFFSSAPSASAGLLSSQGIAVRGSDGTVRTTYSSNERMTLEQTVGNGAASGNNIQFKFFIFSPSGGQVFSHVGNAVPGRVGKAASRLSGVAISGFYTGPGVYRLRGEAHLDAEVDTQEVTFTISSPNILLIYPPNSARDVTDKPLTFRWSSSGADHYRLTVGDNPSFYNSVFSQDTTGNADFLVYPENPSDERQRLGSGTIYYWKVEGLDASNNKVAQSAVPFSFTTQSASLTRDLAVTVLEVMGQSAGKITFQASVENRGGTSESNIQLKFSLGGLPAPGSPVTLPMMGPGDSKSYTFTHTMPSDQGKSLAIACVEFFDDNVPNNCKTQQITAVTDTTGSGEGFRDRELTPDEMWRSVAELLKEQGIDLSDYDVSGMDATMTEQELKDLLSDLRGGRASYELSGPPVADMGDSGGFELPFAGGPGDAPAVGEALSKGEVWDQLGSALRNEGVDLTAYKLVGMDSDLTEGELANLLDLLAKGRAQIDVSGPPISEMPAVDAEEAFSERPAATGPSMLGEVLDKGEVWERLGKELRKTGLDLSRYDLVAMDKEVTQGEMAELLDLLAQGKVQVELSGPPVSETGTGSAAEEDSYRPPLPEEDESAQPAASETGGESKKEWKGFAAPLTGRVQTLKISRRAAWRKLWRRLAGKRRKPKVDFDRYMIVGVVAGKNDRADRIRIDSVRKRKKGILVRYRLVAPEGARRRPPSTRVPYHLKVIDKTGMAVRFIPIRARSRKRRSRK